MQILPLQQASSAQPSKQVHRLQQSSEPQNPRGTNSTNIHDVRQHRHLHVSTLDDPQLIPGDALTRQEKARIWALCGQSQGTWCRRFHRQNAVPFKPAPRGSKTCPKDCSGVGNCNADTGTCECPAGGLSSASAIVSYDAHDVQLKIAMIACNRYIRSIERLRCPTAGFKGVDCTEPQKRPCTNRHSSTIEVPPTSHTGPDGRDRNWLVPGWTAGRCAGEGRTTNRVAAKMWHDFRLLLVLPQQQAPASVDS